MNKLKWLLIIIIIIAAFLRLYNINVTPPGLYPDEAMNGNNALEKFNVFYPENNGREGLFINIQALSLKLFMSLSGSGPEPWMLRMASVLFGIFTVLGIYFLAKELFGKNFQFPTFNFQYKVALLSAFLLATSFWHINFSRIGFRAIMAPFFITWALYFLLKALNSEKFKLNSILGGVFLGLGFHSYIAFRAMPALIIIIWILYWIKNKDSAFRKKLIFSACYFVLAAIIVFAPLGIYFLQNPADFFGRTTQVSVFSSTSPLKDLGSNILKTAGMFIVSGDWNWRHNFAGAPELFWPVGFFFLTGFFWGVGMFFEKIFRRPSEHGLSERESEAESQAASERLGERDRDFRKEYSRAFLILFFWLIIAALPVVISNEGIPHALRSILLIPPAIILAAAGGIWLYELIKGVVINHHASAAKGSKILNILTFIFLLALTFQGYYKYFIQWGENQNVQGAFAADYVAIGRELNSLPQNLPKYVVVRADGVLVRGIPMPAQTVMFITDTFLPEKQAEKNIHYILPSQASEIPQNSYTVILK